MNLLAVKILLAVVGVGGVFAFGYITGQKNMPEIVVECPKCPDITIPECPPSLGSEVSKMKGKYVTFNLQQHYHNSLNADSVVYASMMKDIRDAIGTEFDERKVKKR